MSDPLCNAKFAFVPRHSCSFLLFIKNGYLFPCSSSNFFACCVNMAGPLWRSNRLSLWNTIVRLFPSAKWFCAQGIHWLISNFHALNDFADFTGHNSAEFKAPWTHLSWDVHSARLLFYHRRLLHQFFSHSSANKRDAALVNFSNENCSLFFSIC